MSQTILGDALGVTFQQIQKYENGTNRLGAANLYRTSKALGVEVAFFFEGMTDYENGTTAETGASLILKDNPMTSPEAVTFASDVLRVRDEKVRTRIRQLVKAAAQAGV